MENNLEREINQELERDKLINFYIKKKNKIIFFILFFFIIIFGYQIRLFYYNKKNSENIEKILLSQIYLSENNKKGIDILNKVKESNNETIVILSSNKLIDFYLKRNEMQNVLNEIIFLKQKLKNNSHSLELVNIKEAIVKFDDIKEKEILMLLKKANGEYFASIKKQLIKQYYIKNNQFKKANMN